MEGDSPFYDFYDEMKAQNHPAAMEILYRWPHVFSRFKRYHHDLKVIDVEKIPHLALDEALEKLKKIPHDLPEDEYRQRAGFNLLTSVYLFTMRYQIFIASGRVEQAKEIVEKEIHKHFPAFALDQKIYHFFAKQGLETKAQSDYNESLAQKAFALPFGRTVSVGETICRCLLLNGKKESGKSTIAKPARGV